MDTTTVVFVLSILIWFLCPVIIGLILLQGAAGDISSAFGGGGQLDSTLGVGAHRKMSKVTGVLAGIFFIMILVLAYPHRGSLRNAPVKTAVPAAPEVKPEAKPEAQQPQGPALVVPAVQPEAKVPAQQPQGPNLVVPAAQLEAKVPAKPEDAPAPVADPAPVVPTPQPPAQPAPQAQP